MREHPNAALVRMAYEAIGRGDRHAAGAVVSADAFEQLVDALDPDAGGLYQTRTLVPLALAAAGDVVVAIDHLCARRGGRPLDVEGVVVFAVTDGKIAGVTRVDEPRTSTRPLRSPA